MRKHQPTLTEAPSLPTTDHRKVRHGWPDHEYARFLYTGDPLRAYCGYHIAAERVRCTDVCDQPLPVCPDCLKAWARINQKAAA
ncbi:hypothetical protein [Arthrobacter sp. CJ23]|uniref:hypothetical protein n=1 Tax=Arthrobacter sp. CJ23 TaxID=2972479 RepID=UPI00215BD796|nr:hypothetical protein [Arthrobacter sp. CJ23]UVJ40250.1 hypothetical protein NVV90_03420 [Arthrobacter sp. CJ23]